MTLFSVALSSTQNVKGMIRGASRSSTQNQRSTLYRAELIRRTFGTFYVAIVDAEPKTWNSLFKCIFKKIE